VIQVRKVRGYGKECDGNSQVDFGSYCRCRVEMSVMSLESWNVLGGNFNLFFLYRLVYGRRCVLSSERPKP